MELNFGFDFGGQIFHGPAVGIYVQKTFLISGKKNQ
jgi:hypothetical protein